MDARLQVTDTRGRRVVPLDKPLFTIGRGSGCDLRVLNTDVSRDHADIAHVGGAFILRDRGSRCGTFVNNEPIAERVMVHGDCIRLGRVDATELLFLTEPESSGLLPDVSGSGAPDFRQLAALLDGLRALGSGRVVDEVLTTVIDLAIDVTGADRGFVMLADAGGALEFKVARTKDHTTLAGQVFETSRKVPEQVFHSGRTRVVGDLADDSEVGGHLGTIALGIRHVLCAPLQVHHVTKAGGPEQERVIGVLYLDGRQRGTLLSHGTQEALEAFATEAALAIESARLYSEAADKARLDHDLNIAREIQQGLLPRPEYSGPTFDLAATSIACRTIGGDFFDYLDLDDGRFVFSLGDVAGKGPPAALLATAVQSLAAAQATSTTDPAAALARINAGLLRRAIQSRFATMFYGVLSPDGSLHYSSAGHEPPALVTRDSVLSLEAGGLVLGLFPNVAYESGIVALAPGDVVVVCSDGVTEARSTGDEEFGRERFIASVQDAHGQEPAVVLERLLRDVREFTAGAPQADDLTVVIVRQRV